MFLSLSVGPLLVSANRVGYFLPGVRSELNDAYELSNGTVLLAGAADNLTGLAPEIPVTELPATGITNTTAGKVGFLLHLSADGETILRVVRLPSGAVANLRWIRGTEVPGQPTGALHVSGQTSGGFFVGRLNGNFVDRVPDAFVWVWNAAASGDHQASQSWDVGGDGQAIVVEGQPSSAIIRFLDANGQPRVLPSLRASHYVGGARQQGIGRDVANATESRIVLPSDVTSWTPEDQMAVLPDGNGQLKRGRWPNDFVLPVAPYNPAPNGRSYGYNRYRSSGSYRVVGAAIDRRTGDFYFGFNIQTRFFSFVDVPGFGTDVADFEPAVIAYTRDGDLKWWSRMYHETIDTNGNGQIDLTTTAGQTDETRISEPDQYVDGLALDYSQSDREANSVVVVARHHGNNVTNFWAGNAVQVRPGAGSFQNRFTGTESNVHLTYLCRLRAADGQYQAGTYLAGYFRRIISGKGNWPTVALSEPIYDGWPNPNVGWADVTTTRIEPNAVRVDPAGRVYLVGMGPRMITTANAFQKHPRRLGMNNPTLDEGSAPWSDWVRVYSWDFSALAYSSVLVGQWTYPNGDLSADPVGGDNTTLRGVAPTQSGLFTVGFQNADASNVARGNPIPTANIPAWGATSASGQTAIFARLTFDKPTVPTGFELNAFQANAVWTRAFGLPANSFAPERRPRLVSATPDALIYEWVRLKQPLGLLYRVEGSPDFRQWSVVSGTPTVVPDAALPSTFERVQLSVPLDAARFLRLRVEQ